MLRFFKPLALIGVGCFLGVTMTTGTPNLNLGQNADNSKYATPIGNPSLGISDIEDLVSPEVVEVAISAMHGISDSIDDLRDGIQNGWEEKTEKKLVFARNSSGADYRALNKNLRKR